MKKKKAEEKISTFTIDFFELSFLAEACIPPVPIARMCFWHDLINIHHNNMTVSERAELYGWITKNDRFDASKENCALFEARFNPDNQYMITTLEYAGKTEKRQAFKMKDEYYISTTTWISKDYITKIEKIDAIAN